MNLSDAAGLAILALHDRRLVAAILRVYRGCSTDEDHDALAPRLADESVLGWACRCRAPREHPTESDERRIRQDADDQLARAASLGIVPIALGDTCYPPMLAVISDPPPLLWVRGQSHVLSQLGVGIVASRAATPYALEMARRLPTDLVPADIVVISGLARGVDSAAHRAAVSAQGRTIGVLGCGVDRIYPAEHKTLAREMERCGAVVSEFPPGIPPLPHHFPMRNRIISGLARAVVIVEAPEKSGSLITASAAAEQGRDVLVVPGLAAGSRNRGGHLLIRDGARLVESADDILQDLGICGENRSILPCSANGGAVDEFTVDELVAQTGELPNVVLAKLLELELAGRIQRIGGGRFIRVLS